MMRWVVIVFLLIVILASSGAIYVVQETEQVIITQFGEPVGDPVDTPGLKFKIPFIQKLRVFDRRFLEWESETDDSQLPTKDKVFVIVDTYARWRISDPLLFLERVANERGAQSRLDDILEGETRNAIARHELLEVIRTSNREPIQAEEGLSGDLEGELAPIREGRELIRQQILEEAKKRAEILGIEILDVRFKRINYGSAVLEDVYSRMISERNRISDRFRSQGQGERAEILGDMERELNRIQSEAYRTAEEIRGNADAEATEIYARAYNQSRAAREFYEFLKTMETFEETIDADTWLVLSTGGDFFKFLESSGR